MSYGLWIYSQINVTGPYLWKVNTDSGNGLVLTGNKPLPEPVVTETCVAIEHN